MHLETHWFVCQPGDQGPGFQRAEFSLSSARNSSETQQD